MIFHARVIITRTERGDHMSEIPIIECFGDAEAEITRSFLEAHGICTIMKSSGPRTIYPLTVNGMGRISILVDEKYADKARSLLDEQEAIQTDPDDAE